MIYRFIVALSTAALPCGVDVTDALNTMVKPSTTSVDWDDPLRFQRMYPVSVVLPNTCDEYLVSAPIEPVGDATITCEPGVTIRWTKATDGIIGHLPDVNALDAPGTRHEKRHEGTTWEGFGAHVRVEGCRLEGKRSYASTPTVGSALVGRWKFAASNVSIRSWSLDGVNLDCDVNGTGGTVYGGRSNCNSWRLTDIDISYVGRDAVHVDGGDSNAGDAYGVEARYYGDNPETPGWCWWSDSFLGNTVSGLGCHSGSSYRAIHCTHPGARSLFLAPYIEGVGAGAQEVDVRYPSMVVGGIGLGNRSPQTVWLHSRDLLGLWSHGPSVHLDGYQDQPEAVFFPASEQDHESTVLKIGASVFDWRWKVYGADEYLQVDHANLDNRVVYRLTGQQHPRPGRLWTPQGRLEGPQAAVVQHGSCPPTDDPAGLPLASQHVCTDPVAGQPHTWRVVTSSTGPGQEWEAE